MAVAACELTRYQGLLWSVEVGVAGRLRRFLLDLGAGVTALDVRLAEDLGLREVRSVSGRRLTGQALELPLLRPLVLTVAGVPLAARSPCRLDVTGLLPPDWPPVDGVLALDVLEDRAFRLDFAEDRLEIGAVGDVSGLAAVPFRPYRQIPEVSLVVLVAVDAADGRLWFELDNSNTGPVLLSSTAAARLGVVPGLGPHPVRLSVPGLGPVVTPALVRDLLYDGNLGRTFVDRRCFAFDLRANGFWVGPAVPG